MSDQLHIAACRGAMRQLIRYVRPDAPLRRLLVFLWVAEHEPVTLAEISRSVGAAPGTVYDDLRALGTINAAGKAGLRLVQEMPGGAGEPAHRYALSVRGKAAVAALRLELGALCDPAEYEDDDPLKAYWEAKRNTRG